MVTGSSPRRSLRGNVQRASEDGKEARPSLPAQGHPEHPPPPSAFARVLGPLVWSPDRDPGKDASPHHRARHVLDETQAIAEELHGRA